MIEDLFVIEWSFRVTVEFIQETYNSFFNYNKFCVDLLDP